MAKKQLTADQRQKVEYQLQRAYDADADPSALIGEHWILIGLLNQLGYFCISKEDAYRIAEDILSC